MKASLYQVIKLESALKENSLGFAAGVLAELLYELLLLICF